MLVPTSRRPHPPKTCHNPPRPAKNPPPKGHSVEFSSRPFLMAPVSHLACPWAWQTWRAMHPEAPVKLLPDLPKPAKLFLPKPARTRHKPLTEHRFRHHGKGTPTIDITDARTPRTPLNWDDVAAPKGGGWGVFSGKVRQAVHENITI